jgi:hypothetical protein
VKLYYKNPYKNKEETVSATLLSNNGGPVFKIGDEITFGHPGRVIFPSVPENLISRPTLIWLLDNSLTKSQRLEVSYLTEGINWNADYVLTLNEKDDMADLSGWVTIDNRSGATYKEAGLKLVAGDIHRAPRQVNAMYLMKAKAPLAEGEQFKEEAFFEYHIYTLQRRTTVKDNQTKQISLLSATDIPVDKKLIYRGAAYYYRTRHREVPKQKVEVFIEVSNKKEHNLGMPLPNGTVRVYKRDTGGSLQFIGEDSIDHTPKDETIKVKVGEAFDVVVERKQTVWEKIRDKTYEVAFEISIRNHKEDDVVVKVIEPVPGDWKMLRSSHDYEKTDAHTVEFDIPVARDKETKLLYRVRLKF